MDATTWLILILITKPSAIAAIYFALDIPRRKASLDWPVTIGVVTKTKVSDFAESYSATVWYSYSVNNREYFKNRYKVGSYSSYICETREIAVLYLRKFPLESNVEVFYDPTEPAYGALKRGFPIFEKKAE